MVNKLRVKICGITNLADARYSAGAGADYLGFIQSEASPRYVDPDLARQIIEWVAGVETVGVFVNADADDVNEIASLTGFDMIQLHGDESVDYCRKMDKPVIKVLRVRDDEDPANLKERFAPYVPHVEAFLLDTFVEDVPGGTGKTFSWGAVAGMKIDRPVFLAGGLTPANAAEAVKVVHPFAIDVASGLEAEPGVKDFEAIDRLFDAVSPYRERDEE